ncbi:MAG: metallophosphoesterase [Alcaligenaceae bacterium]|nr:metallophosphoesterase [Alcaligenaceae bacterium]
MNDYLLQTIPDQPMDIIGDIHGEIQALEQLLCHLGHDSGKQPPRKLVFIGDLCDRGPDSVAVIERVRSLVEQGHAYAILGNHEINLLMDEPKDGAGWFFDARRQPDMPHYAPFTRATPTQRPAIREFFRSLPLALESPSLRIVHAAWDPQAISAIAHIPRGEIVEVASRWEQDTQIAAQTDNLYQRYLSEKTRWAAELEDPDHPPPYLDAVARYEVLEQQINPIKRLTSGIEAKSAAPFYSGNRWRYSDRTAWWDSYADDTPVVIGHYWRMFNLPSIRNASRYSLLFNRVNATAWHGRNHRVFCVDYSVGARWRDRKAGHPERQTRFRLAALRWPECTLTYDNGERLATQNAPTTIPKSKL